MKVYKKDKSKAKRGASLLDNAINGLPMEIHLPGYQYCGPGTKLEGRLQRGDKGINGLDMACKKHDTAYLKHKSGDERRKADRILGDEAWARVKSSDAKLAERAAALAVTGVMKAKTKLGLGLSKSNRSKSSKEKKTKKKSKLATKI